MSVTWFHISDFHFRTGDSYDRNVVLRALVRSATHYRRQGRAPDLIFATGDIAHSGQAAEYDVASKFFDALLKALDLPRSRLFVIPGNHDADREVGSELRRTLTTREDSDRYFTPQRPKPHIANKFGPFLNWFDSYFSGVREFPRDSSCGKVEVVSVKGQTLAVLPINSAIFSLDDADHSQLWLGRRCLDSAVQELEDAKNLAEDVLRIALMHHPIDWLHEYERANIRSILHQHTDVILRGHLHETEVETAVPPIGQALHIAAGAAYQSRRYPNRAYYATLDNDRSLTIFPVRYEDSPNEVWTTDPSVFPSDKGHERRFSLGASGHAYIPHSTKPSLPRAPEGGPALPAFRSNISSRGRAPFRGRDALLAEMVQRLSNTSTEQVLVLHGPPGVGKSELSREYARQQVDRYPGGRFLLNGGSEQTDLARIGTNILGLQFPPELPLADQCEQTLLNMPARATLLIFDNPASYEDIRTWLPRAGMPLHALITTTNEQWCDDLPSLPVQPLPDAVALELVEVIGGAEVARQLGSSLVALAGGLPVQLVPATRALAYEERRGRLNGAAVSLASEARDSFDLALRTLPASANVLLHAACFLSLQRILPDELMHHIAPLLRVDRVAFDRMLDACVDLHLLEGSNELRMHQLLATHLEARRASDVKPSDLNALRWNQAARLIELAKQVIASPNMAPHVVAFLSYPLGHRSWAGTTLSTDCDAQLQVGKALAKLGRFEEAKLWFEGSADCTPRDGGGKIKDHERLGRAFHHVGSCLSDLGRYEEARPWLEQAVFAKEMGGENGIVDHESVGASLNALGHSLSRRGLFAEAMPWLEKAVDEAKQGDLSGVVSHRSLGAAHSQVGKCLANMKRFEDAKSWFEKARSEAVQADAHGRINHHILGTCLHEIGYCLTKMNMHKEALPFFEQAVEEKSLGDEHGRVDRASLGISVHLVGDCLLSQGKVPEARTCFERAVAEKTLGDLHARVDHESLSASTHQVGYCSSCLEAHEDAKTSFEQAVALAEKGDVHGRVNHDSVGSSMRQVGHSLSQLGRYEEALSWFERAKESVNKGDIHGRVSGAHLAALEKRLAEIKRIIGH